MNKNCKILIIGESPSHTRPDGMKNIPFSGRTSYHLWDELKKYNISREDCVITNVVENLLPKGNKPTSNMIKDNLPRLYSTIKKYDIKLIMTMGRIPTEAILEQQIKMREIAGNIFYTKDENAIVIPCIHPAAVERNLINKILFEKSIKNAMIILEDIKKLYVT